MIAITDKRAQRDTDGSQKLLCAPPEATLAKFQTSREGLRPEEAEKRLKIYGTNEVEIKKKESIILEFLHHFQNPLMIILLACAGISYMLGESRNSIIIFLMVFMSVVLDFFQEYRAERAAEKLKKRVATMATVIRNNTQQPVKVSEIVPGDIIFLSAGDIIPADARVIDAKDLFIDQSALTGESFPVEKTGEPIKPKDISTITNWTNYLFMGTSVVSGTATAVVVKTGTKTEYGEIVKKNMEKRPETEFEKGLNKFGYLITSFTLVLFVLIFIGNTIYRHDVLQSLLFAVAVAVGLTPELLPMILSINLSKGAFAMAKKGVIVKRLNSIQNFGSMNILCSDKTGTLTENKVTVILHVDINGKNNEKVFFYSVLNSRNQTGIRNAMDDAIMRHEEINISGYKKIDELPFDFARKRISVIVQKGNNRIMITKGAPEEILKISSSSEISGKVTRLTDKVSENIHQKFREISSDGFRVLGVAYKKLDNRRQTYKINDESDMVFIGFVAFMDPPKKTAPDAIMKLEKAGIQLKILTGDDELVTKRICKELGFKITGIVLGNEIVHMNEEVLARAVEQANIFARVTPVQKNRIMAALKANGHVVGFLGDGINDSPSMRTADVGISVENAVDIAKESADLILLHHDLNVLEAGVLEGRKTFGNTMKYILMGLSSNFGNMLSAAGGSLFLPFLPMLPLQILLNNLLYDISQFSIPLDNVDEDYIKKPKRIDINFIRNFTIFFGPFSSIYDFLTFFVMLWVFRAPEHLFQTAWFVESLTTQTMIMFVIRTRHTPFWKSKPNLILTLNMLGIVALAWILPFTPIAQYFQFVPIPPAFLGILVVFVVTYLGLVEACKGWFYKKFAPEGGKAEDIT